MSDDFLKQMQQALTGPASTTVPPRPKARYTVFVTSTVSKSLWIELADENGDWDDKHKAAEAALADDPFTLDNVDDSVDMDYDLQNGAELDAWDDLYGGQYNPDGTPIDYADDDEYDDDHEYDDEPDDDDD